MKWYEKHKKLNAALFTWENSGKKLGDAPPYHNVRNDNFDIEGIEGIYGMEKIYKLLGYTEDPAFHAKGYPSVAIMFERQDTYEKIWWHYEVE